MGQEWSIRAYEDGDENSILELQGAIHGEVENRDEWLRRWNWKFKNNPAGGSLIWVAKSNDKVVAQYAVTLVKMKVDNQIITASQSVDTMTHPDYQGRGIFLALTQEVFKEASKKGVNIIFGFPNKLASWHDKYWLKVGVLCTMIKPLNLDNIFKQYISNRMIRKLCILPAKLVVALLFRAGNPRRLDDVEIAQVKSFDERINGLWEKISKDYKMLVVRDREYLNWRYVNIPNGDYEIFLAEKGEQAFGYMILRCVSQRGLRVGYILDLAVPSREQAIARSLIRKAVKVLKEKKADLILFPLIANRALNKTVRKNGFFSLRFISKKLPFVVRANTPRISDFFLKEPGYWFVQMGDSDIL
jgi:hypothetical protein